MLSRDYYNGKSAWSTPGNTERIRNAPLAQGMVRGLRSVCFGSNVIVKDAATGLQKRIEDQFGNTIKVF